VCRSGDFSFDVVCVGVVIIDLLLCVMGKGFLLCYCVNWALITCLVLCVLGQLNLVCYCVYWGGVYWF